MSALIDFAIMMFRFLCGLANEAVFPLWELTADRRVSLLIQHVFKA
jgi:hypothetical protein